MCYRKRSKRMDEENLADHVEKTWLKIVIMSAIFMFLAVMDAFADEKPEYRWSFAVLTWYGDPDLCGENRDASQCSKAIDVDYRSREQCESTLIRLTAKLNESRIKDSNFNYLLLQCIRKDV